MGQNFSETVSSWTPDTNNFSLASMSGLMGSGVSQEQQILNQVDELWEKCGLNQDQSLSMEASGPLVREIFRQQMKKSGLEVTAEASQEIMTQIFNQIDVDKSQTIERQELIDFLKTVEMDLSEVTIISDLHA